MMGLSSAADVEKASVTNRSLSCLGSNLHRLSQLSSKVHISLSKEGYHGVDVCRSSFA